MSIVFASALSHRCRIVKLIFIRKNLLLLVGLIITKVITCATSVAPQPPCSSLSSVDLKFNSFYKILLLFL